MSVGFRGQDERVLEARGGRSYPRAVRVPERIEHSVEGGNMGNVTARALLQLLELGAADGDLCGSCSVPEARRSVMQARARFHTRAPSLVQQEFFRMAGRPRPDGTVELGVRLHFGGLSAETLQDRLESFARLVEYLAAHGATRIVWD